MKIFFHKGTNWRWSPTRLDNESDMLALSFNNWDDYSISTSLNAVLYLGSEKVLEFSLKLYIEDDKYSPQKLNELRDKGWDGFFPIPNLNYISVPSDIDFYSAILGKLSLEKAANVLKITRDASYLINVEDDKEALRLSEHPDFVTSALREAGARKAFTDGWAFFSPHESKIKDFVLNARKYNGLSEPISFKFNSENLPYDINLLIGPNGIGKSYTLKSLVEYWLGVESGDIKKLEKLGHVPFDKSPNISKLILISYSPFEEFTIDLNRAKLQDKDAYKYFGFRQHVEKEDGNTRIGISRNLPARDSIASLMKAFSDDHKFSFMPKWQSKVETIWSVLQPAIEFDSIGFQLEKAIEGTEEIPNFPALVVNDEDIYLQIDNEVFELMQEWGVNIADSLKFEEGVIFLKDGAKVKISSGQRLFCYIVLNVVGQIRNDSLVVIDEPELFLHPTLEIEFISLLKQVLKAFKSKAILATHSLAIAREIPANCIHVYRKHEGQMEVEHPPFETFGGNVQRISSYVFGDKSVTKPFDEWLEEKMKEDPDAEKLIHELGDEINEEMTMKILSLGRKFSGS
ncbi:AAA family ATPase [Pseudoalteromonas distincta]|uniref:AAA family ATPase n=1 Tax=Pseudoalteromonas distincta TaxID=77608 RepID=UPI0034E864E9